MLLCSWVPRHRGGTLLEGWAPGRHQGRGHLEQQGSRSLCLRWLWWLQHWGHRAGFLGRGTDCLKVIQVNKVILPGD